MCLCHFERISDNPSAIKLFFSFQISEHKIGFALGKLRAHSSHFSMVTCVYVEIPLQFYWLQRFKWDVNHQNQPMGSRETANTPISTQMTPGVFFVLLNLSKKVKCHLFCINLDTGYLLYVIVWIPKAFSLRSHHSRVVFTMSNDLFLDGHYNLHFFTMFNLNLL